MIIIITIKVIDKNLIMITIITLNILLLSIIMYRYTFIMSIVIMLELSKIFVNTIII